MDIKVEDHVDDIKMPENLRVGLMVTRVHEECGKGLCDSDFYGFGFGQSPFHVPETLTRALADNARKGQYSDAEGILPLREAIADFNKKYFNMGTDPSRIIVGPGTKQLINMVFDIVKGDVILPSPSWIGYFPQITLLRKHFHTFRLKPEHSYKINPLYLEDFLRSLRHDQHMLVINNPHNPTGALYSRDELEAITEVCRRYNTLVLADEIYALTTYEFSQFTSMGLVYPEGTFITNGLSKDRSSGGYRLGALILPESCPEKLKDDFKKVAAIIYTNVATPIQFAAIKAYLPSDEIEEYIAVTRDIHRMMGLYLSKEFNKIEGIKATIPEGGFYFYLDFNEIAGDLRRKGVTDSNRLAESLVAPPYFFVVVTGDAVMLRPDDYGARVAFVDYEGKRAYEDYLANPPKNPEEEKAFIKRNASHMIESVNVLQDYVKFIKS